MTMSQAPVARRLKVPEWVPEDWKRETDSIRTGAVEAARERLEMLFGEDGRRREHGGLLAVERGDVGRAHGDFGLAVAGVAADEAVHRLASAEILLDGRDGRELVGRLLVGEGGLEGVKSVARDVIDEAGHDLTLGLCLEQGRRKIGDGLLGVGLVLVPPFAVQAVQMDLFALDAHIAREEVGVSRGDVELGAVGVFDREDLAPLAVHQDFRGADEASHAIVHMDDVLARFEVVEVVEARTLGGHRARETGLLLGEDAVRLGHDQEPLAAWMSGGAGGDLKAA